MHSQAIGNERALLLRVRRPDAVPMGGTRRENFKANRRAEWMKRARPTQTELEALWRPRPEFIGPVAPPMWLWMHDREKQRAWRKTVNLKPKDDDNEPIP